jgi:hypothetical protein
VTGSKSCSSALFGSFSGTSSDVHTVAPSPLSAGGGVIEYNFTGGFDLFGLLFPGISFSVGGITGPFILLTGDGPLFGDLGFPVTTPFTVATEATPLPAALPLFATGLGALGLLGWRRKRKARAVA